MSRERLTWSLCDSATMSSIDIFRHGRGRTITEDLNRPGSASLRIPLDDPLGTQVEPIRTCIKVARGSNIVWSGPVWTIVDQTDENMGWTTIGAVGWQEILHHRVLNPPDQKIQLTDTSDGMINALLAAANAKGPTLTGAASSTFITIGSLGSNNVQLTRTFDFFTNIGDAIFQLTQLENGVDVWVDPGTRKLNVTALRGTVKDGAALRLKGARSNVTSAIRNVDASRLANRFWVVGASSATGYADDSGSQGTYGLFEDQQSLSDVSDSTILGAYANAELVTKGRPIVTYELAPSSYVDGVVPMVYEDFTLGDFFTFSIEQGRIDVTSQIARCFGFTLADQDDGNEKITSLKLLA